MCSSKREDCLPCVRILVTLPRHRCILGDNLIFWTSTAIFFVCFRVIVNQRSVLRNPVRQLGLDVSPNVFSITTIAHRVPPTNDEKSKVTSVLISKISVQQTVRRTNISQFCLCRFMILLLNFGLPKSRTRVISSNLGLCPLLQQTLRRWSNIWYFCLCKSGIPRLDQRQSLLRCQPEIHKDSEPIYSIIIRTQVADADSRVCTSLWKCLANSSSPHVLVSLGKIL